MITLSARELYVFYIELKVWRTNQGDTCKEEELEIIKTAKAALEMQTSIRFSLGTSFSVKLSRLKNETYLPSYRTFTISILI
jgi:hypothetical protein